MNEVRKWKKFKTDGKSRIFTITLPYLIHVAYRRNHGNIGWKPTSQKQTLESFHLEMEQFILVENQILLANMSGSIIYLGKAWALNNSISKLCFSLIEFCNSTAFTPLKLINLLSFKEWWWRNEG
jgi:hypothetical protein